MKHTVKEKYIYPCYEFILRFAASGIIPGRWFLPHPPDPNKLAAKSGRLTIEVVSHCWQYANFLRHQLDSVTNYPPATCKIIFTVFYSDEDIETLTLLKSYDKFQHNNVQLNFQNLPTPSLLRRAIGRNLAAKTTTADWIWFTDCDLLFQRGCFDSLAQQLQNRKDVIVFPKKLKATCLLTKEDDLLRNLCTAEQSIASNQFVYRKYKKATGPIQIVHGDVARKSGYCDSLAVYQQPKSRWVKTYEDRAFRWLMGTHGTPVEIENLYLIRHQEKGRYKKDSKLSVFRKYIRILKAK
ncbi:Glycosyl transferase family 2 [Rheinheimera sp. A13L]|uniref:glycosyltransferase family A protein n=1 Tax=Rheinheimera sp. A13L TaxID=506534 RepID=UPI000212525F|nr:Glycosyl transferase family 2 [Rheinheimera sp. A13L]